MHILIKNYETMKLLNKMENQLDRYKDTTRFLKSVDCSDLSVIVTGTQISVLRREAKGVLVAAVVMLIEDITRFFKTKTSFGNEEDVVSVAESIIDRFWYLKLEELAIIFDRAKNMRYGKVYDRLDEATITEWIVRYEEGEREQWLYDSNNRLKDEATSGTDLRIDYGAFRLKK